MKRIVPTNNNVEVEAHMVPACQTVCFDNEAQIAGVIMQAAKFTGLYIQWADGTASTPFDSLNEAVSRHSHIKFYHLK